eukprot:1588064-Alexandrium_andersonii.AAC.1
MDVVRLRRSSMPSTEEKPIGLGCLAMDGFMPRWVSNKYWRSLLPLHPNVVGHSTKRFISYRSPGEGVGRCGVNEIPMLTRISMGALAHNA